MERLHEHASLRVGKGDHPIGDNVLILPSATRITRLSCSPQVTLRLCLCLMPL